VCAIYKIICLISSHPKTWSIHCTNSRN